MDHGTYCIGDLIGYTQIDKPIIKKTLTSRFIAIGLAVIHIDVKYLSCRGRVFGSNDDT